MKRAVAAEVLRPILCLSLLFVVLGCRHASTGDDWMQVTAQDGSFTILMPGKPTIRQVAAALPNGSVIGSEYKYSNAPVAIYGLTYYDLPDSLGPIDPDRLLNASVQGSLNTLAGRDPMVTPTTMRGYPARNVELTTSDGARIFSRECLVGRRLYKLAAVYLKIAKRSNVSERATRFFDSFAPTANK